MEYDGRILNPTEEEFNRWLSTQTMRGTIGGGRLSDLAQEQPMQPMNTIRNNATGRVIDMNYATKPLRDLTEADQQAAIEATGGRRTNYDVHIDGPREVARRQLPDGRTEVIREYPALQPTVDGRLNQTSKLVREIETPDYLNPAASKQIDFKLKQAQLEKAQKEAQGGDAKPQFHDGQWVYPPSADNPQGQSVPISGFKTKPTEDQGKTAYNVSRILQSAKMLQDAVTKNPSAIAPGDAEAVASVTPLWGSAQEGLKNLARDKDRQVVYQSQADIIDSLLFLATGAAYNKEQLEQQRASYQPNWTDKPEAINAKNERMKGLIESAKVRAGSAWTPEMDSALSVLNIPAIGGGTKAPAPAAPTRGMIKGGYLYKGGDPSKPESWMKVK